MAAVDYFLKIDGVLGESTDDKHKDEIEIESFSWGATQTGSFAFGGGAGAGKVSFQDLHFATSISKASPKLMLKCAMGEHIKSAVLTARKSTGEGGGEAFLKLTFTDVLVSSYQSGGVSTPPVVEITDNLAAQQNVLALANRTGGLPTDQGSLRYASVKFVEGPQTHIDIRPAATGIFAFDTKTGDWTIAEGPDGNLTVGTEGGVVHRAVQKFDVSDIKSLINLPFGRVGLSVNEMRSDDTPGAEKSPPDPNLHFDVILFPTDDVELGPLDLNAPGERIGSLHIDPRGEAASLDVDITKLVLDQILIGLRVELRGTPVAVDPSDPSGRTELTADQTASGDVVLKGRNILINFTTALSFDSA